MKYSKEQYEKKLIGELGLHDSEVRGIKFQNNNMTIKISCKGMKPEFYFEGIDDITIIISVTNVKKMSFDFMDSIIIIYNFCINRLDNGYSISINDGKELYVEMLNIKVEFEEHKSYNNSYKLLDEFLKSNK